MSCSFGYSKRKNSDKKIGDDIRLLDFREIWHVQRFFALLCEASFSVVIWLSIFLT
jgi:hypothetical protein